MKVLRPSTRMSASRRMFWVMIFAFLIAGGLLSLGVFLFTPGSASANQSLPVSLHSPLRADYSPDERGMLLPQLDLELAAEAARDRLPTAGPTGSATAPPFNPIPTMQEELRTPVPTVTPIAGSTRSALPTATPRLEATLPPSSATPASSATLAPSATLAASATLPANATWTSTPAAGITRVPTQTPPAATQVSTLPPTRTLPPPTSTLPPPPTQTPVPLPTNTPVPPPTRTPVPLPTDPPPSPYPQPTDPPPPTPGPTPYP